MISNGIAQHDIAVIDHPAVTRFDCGFIVNTNDFGRDDHIVIRSGVVVPVLVQFLRYVRLYTDEPDICMSEFCLSDSGRKQSVEFSHRAGVECLATVLDCNKDSFFNLFADIFKYFPVTESAASFHYSLTISNQNIYPSTLYLVYLVRSTIIAD